MTTTYNPSVHRLAVFTACWTILLFVAGALVTSKDAALSVPDWPKSFGTWFPSLRMLGVCPVFEHAHPVFVGGGVALFGFCCVCVSGWVSMLLCWLCVVRCARVEVCE